MKEYVKSMQDGSKLLFTCLPALSYQKLLENDTGMMVGEIQSTMKDRDLWQQCICERVERRLDK